MYSENPGACSSVKVTKISLNRMLIIMVLLAGSLLNNAFGQSISNYAFQASSGTFTPLTGSTPVPALLVDESLPTQIPLGFSFYFMGKGYTHISTCPNGYITFSANPSILAADMQTNNFTLATADHPVLAPFWDDLMGGKSTGTPVASYLTSGVPGSRIFTMEWLYWAPSNIVAIAPVLSFQVQLEEATGVIRYIYRQDGGSTANGGATIGISSSPSSYLSLNNAGATPTVSNSVSTNNITARPATGQIYTFTPPSVIPSSPVNLSFSAIGLYGMTVNWDDNSTDETSFVVFKSTDNITFTAAGTVTSTSSATTGNPYSLVVSGLSPNTTYYYKVVATTEGNGSAPVTGNRSTLAGSVCGVKSVGTSPSADYPSITAALTDIQTNGLNCSTILELEPAYVSSVETFPINFTNYATTSAKTITIRPQAGATNLQITSAAAVTLNFDGASNIIIDGYAGGVGSTRELTVENTVNTGVAIQFINGASYNVVKNSNIAGVNNSTTAGVVFINTTSTTNGNSYNTIENNSIHDGITTPLYLIYSKGTVGRPNIGNVISSNLLYNAFSTNISFAAMNIQTNNSGYTISGNHIYQTVSRTITSGTTNYGIQIASTSGASFQVSGNFIGGTAPNAGGAPMTITSTAGTKYIGIGLLNAPSTGVNSFDGNTITNISFTTAANTSTLPGIFAGISAGVGNVNIGTTTPNNIGDVNGNSIIQITTSGNDGNIFGISYQGSNTATISNNLIGGFNLANTFPGTVKTHFTGISANNGTVNITGNTIGGSLPGSIINSTGNTSTTVLNTVGISYTGTIKANVSNNTIQNMWYAANGSGAVVAGMSFTNGQIVADNNIIRYLESSSPNIGTNVSTSVIGVSIASSVSGHSLTRTKVYGLNNTNSSAAVGVLGIYYAGSTGTNTISRNHIYGLTAASTSSAAYLTGILVNGGTSVYSNNIINLGLNETGASIANALVVTGINKTSTTSNNFYYNTIRIQGAGVSSGTANTYGFRRASATVADELKNNIISNTRENASTGGNHYALGISGSNFTALKNVYWVTGPVFGNLSVDYPTLSAWKAGTSLDATSFHTDPHFISSLDSHIDNTIPSSLESAVPVTGGINIDFDGDARPGPSGSVNGGGVATDLGADEFDGIPVLNDIGLTTLVSPVATGCYTSSETVTVEIKNFSTTAIDFSINPATVTVSVTGPNPMTFASVTLNTGILAPSAMMNVAISSSYDMSAAGMYVFNPSVSISGDANTSNDVHSPVSIGVIAGNASASSMNTCPGQNIMLTLAGSTGPIQWQSSVDGSTWVNETGAGNTAASYSVAPMDTISYRALVCGQAVSNALVVNSTDVIAPVAANVTRCGYGPVTMNATGNGDFKWYNSSTSTNPIAVGSSYTANVGISTTFYVSANAGGQELSVGLINKGNGSQQTSTEYNRFTVYSPVVLSGVYIYPGAAGNAVLELRSHSGAVINSATLAVTSADVNQKTWFPLNWNLPIGNDYRLGQGSGSVSMFRNDDVFSFTPFSIPGVISITGSSIGTPYYYFTYDWRVIVPCESPRTAVQVTVTPSPAITVTSSNSAICPGSNSTLGVSSTNAGYDYIWTPSTGLSTSTGSSVTASPSATTTYTVSATDASGCQASSTVTLDVLQVPVVTVSPSPAVVCSGSGTTLSVANPSVGDTYSWTPATDLSSVSISNPVASPTSAITYTVTVTGVNGCVASATVPVSVNTGTTLSVTSNDATCFGASNGMATASSVGGSVWSYSWNTVPAQTSAMAMNLSAGTYTVVSSNEFGCTDTASVVINSPLALNANFTTTTVTCFGGNDGAATATINGGTAPYTYSWNTFPSQTTASINGLSAGSYSVSVMDANGCVHSGIATVLDGAVVNVSISGNSLFCSGTSTTLTANGASSYLWNTSDVTAAISVSPVATTTYTVTGTDGNGCTGSQVISVTPELPTNAQFTYNTATGLDFDFTATGGGAYSSDFGDLSTGTGAVVSHSYSTGSYSVVLTATNSCGSTTANQTIVVSGLEATNASKVSVYPNPSKGVFNISMKGVEASRITVLDVNGQIVMDEVVNAASLKTIDLSAQAKGVYTLRMIGEKTENFRLILN